MGGSAAFYEAVYTVAAAHGVSKAEARGDWRTGWGAGSRGVVRVEVGWGWAMVGRGGDRGVWVGSVGSVGGVGGVGEVT